MPRKKAGRQTKKQIEAKARLKGILSRALKEDRELTLEELKEMDPEIVEVLSPNQIIGMIGYLSSPISKGIEEPTGEVTEKETRQPPAPTEKEGEKRLPKDRLPSEEVDEEVGEVTKVTEESKSKSIEVGDTPLPTGEVEAVARRATGREIELMISPVIRKVVLDWRILGYFDYARSEFDLEDDYDLGDFLVDCVKIAMQKGAGVGIEFVKRRRAD